MWKQALGKCIEPGKQGVLVGVFGEDFGGATDFLTSKGYSTLSVFLNRVKKGFLKSVEGSLAWKSEESFAGGGGEIKFSFGVREEGLEEGQLQLAEVATGGARAGWDRRGKGRARWTQQRRKGRNPMKVGTTTPP